MISVKVKVKLNKKPLEKLISELSNNNYESRVGVLKGGEVKDEETGTTVATYGFYNEFGTLSGDRVGKSMGLVNKNEGTVLIPPRSFIRYPLIAHLGKRIIEHSQILADIIFREKKLKKAYSFVADIGKNIVVMAFITKNDGYGNWKPNAKSTIEKKGINNPLIEKGNLLGSINGEVHNKQG